MTRLSRLDLAAVPQQVIQLGNNREVCFIDEKYYKVYLPKLEKYAKKLKVTVHAYVLMTNYVHLLLTPDKIGTVSRLI